MKPTVNTPQTKEKLIELDLDTMNFSNHYSMSSFFKTVRFISLETKKECLIGNIDEIKIKNDTVFVLDKKISKSLFIFDKSGKFIRKIGKLGRGPGEYERLSSFSIDRTRNQILIQSNKKIITYSNSGEFIKEFNLLGDTPLQISCQDSIIYFDRMPSFYKQDQYNLLSAANTEGEVIYRWLPAKSYEKVLNLSCVLGSHFFNTMDELKYTYTFSDTIFSINNKTVSPFIAFSTQNKLTNEEINELKSIDDPMKLGQYVSNCKRFQGAVQYLESNNLIMIKIKNHIATPKILINPHNKKISCTHFSINDDITYTEQLQFATTTNNSFVSIIDHSYMKPSITLFNNFIQNIKSANIKLSETEKNLILDLQPDCNPILAFYECI